MPARTYTTELVEGSLVLSVESHPDLRLDDPTTDLHSLLGRYRSVESDGDPTVALTELIAAPLAVVESVEAWRYYDAADLAGSIDAGQPVFATLSPVAKALVMHVLSTPVIASEQSWPVFSSLAGLALGCSAGFMLAGPPGALVGAIFGGFGTVLVKAGEKAGESVGGAYGDLLAAPVRTKLQNQGLDHALAKISSARDEDLLTEEQAGELRLDAFKKYL